MGSLSQKEFAEAHNLDASYLSQLINGHRKLGEKAASNLEEKIGLASGTLVHPVDEDEQVYATLSALQGKVTPRSREVLNSIEAAANQGKLTEEDLLLLERIAKRFEKDRAEKD